MTGEPYRTLPLAAELGVQAHAQARPYIFHLRLSSITIVCAAHVHASPCISDDPLFHFRSRRARTKDDRTCHQICQPLHHASPCLCVNDNDYYYHYHDARQPRSAASRVAGIQWLPGSRQHLQAPDFMAYWAWMPECRVVQAAFLSGERRESMDNRGRPLRGSCGWEQCGQSLPRYAPAASHATVDFGFQAGRRVFGGSAIGVESPVLYRSVPPALATHNLTWR